MQVSLIFLAVSGIASLAAATQLPSVSAEVHARSARAPGHWWAQMGDRVFTQPPVSLIALSQNVSDYYYLMGSKSALTPAMEKHVVGSQGRYHIMHLPQGPSMLQVSAKSYRGDRRSSISSLTQLESGTVLSTSFPTYKLSADYQHPLDQAGQDLEKATVATITPDSAMDYLKKLVQLPTRSYSNATASAKAEAFLKSEFEAMGLHVCYHTFDNSGSKMTNVIAHLPGNDRLGAVIVGAHYDSRPFEGAAPGAEDNGSGVASMLAIAKAFMASKAKPKKSVFFIAFAGEEAGCIGSQFFANALQEGDLPRECTPSTSFLQRSAHSKKTFKAADYSAIIMDEIGWLSPKLKIPTVNLESYDSSKEVMDHLRHATQEHNGDKLDVVHNSNPYGSDHMSFLDKGIKGVLTINGDDEAYPHYHQSSDKIQNDDGTFNVDAHFMQMISKMNLGAMMRMAL